MTVDNPYSPLGYPFNNLPRPDKPVSALTLYDTGHPLLQGARALLTAVSVRGYPETSQQRRTCIKQLPCGSEMQGNCCEQAGSP